MAETIIPRPVSMGQVKDLSALAFQSVCPNNAILFDDLDAPSVMVKIPKMTLADLGLGVSTATHPAFIINGAEVDAIYISKYQNIVQNGRAYSLPGQDPKDNINYDEAHAACRAKGAGWHLMTRAEWALLALWCKANNTQPNGCNNYGKDVSETVRKAIPTRFSNGLIQRVATGTGPISWSHDGTVSGIWDLNGNVSEFVGGLRSVYGELQILENNNAADSSKSQSAISGQWKAIRGSDGALITPNGSGTTNGSIKLDWVSNHAQFDTSITDSEPGNHSCTFEAITCSENIGDTAKTLLQTLGLFKYDATSESYNGDALWFNNGNEEALPVCGGQYSNGVRGGVFASSISATRSEIHTYFGFRSAFVNMPTA